MTTVNTLTELHNELVSLDVNVKRSWPFLIVDNMEIGLFNETFSIKRGDDTSYCRPKDIVKTITDIVPENRKVKDSELFSIVIGDYPELASHEKEEEFYELDLDNDPINSMNEWLAENMVDIKVISCDDVDGDVTWTLLNS